MNCNQCEIPIEERICTDECKKEYIRKVKSKAGKIGGKIGGKLVHELHPGEAIEWGKKTHRIHPEQASRVMKNTITKNPNLCKEAGKLGGKKIAETNPEHMKRAGKLGATKRNELHPGLSIQIMKDNHKKYPNMAHECGKKAMKRHSEIRKELGFRSESEKILWESEQFQKFNPKREPTVHLGKKWIYPDFVINKLIIEIDGSFHNCKQTKIDDEIKNNLIQQYGYKILRFSNKDIKQNIEMVINKIKENMCD